MKVGHKNLPLKNRGILSSMYERVMKQGTHMIVHSFPPWLRRAFCILTLGAGVSSSALPSLAASALKTVRVVLVPVDAPSTMPSEYKAYAEGSKLPANWKGRVPRPQFPRELERVGINGTVTIEFVTNARGYIVFAGVLHATDVRFAESVLTAWRLRDHPPAGTPPETPSRLVQEIGFTVTPDSTVLDPHLTPVVSTTNPTKKRYSFVRAADHVPRFVDLADAMKRVKTQMSRIEVIEQLGPPISEVFDQRVGFLNLMLYGPSFDSPVAVITLEGGQVTSVKGPARLPRRR